MYTKESVRKGDLLTSDVYTILRSRFFQTQLKFYVVFIFSLIFFSFFPSFVQAATYTVTKTADTNDGTCDADCSLREAMTAANSNAGTDNVGFSIPTADSGYRDFDDPNTSGSGDSISGDDYWTIRPSTALPTLTGTTALDATTQTTNQGDKNTLGPEIEVKGTGTSGINCILSSSTDTIIKGFVVNNCAAGITLAGTNPTVSGNYIGVDAKGTTMVSNQNGITINFTTNGTIGGLNESDRNIISGNKNAGIAFGGNHSSPTSGINIYNNYINVDRTGITSIIYNYGVSTTHGIYAAYSKNNINVGNGTAAGRNIINGGNYGIQIQLSSNNWNIRGNYFGLAADGVTQLSPIYALAVAIDSGSHHNDIGGASEGDRNYIADATFATIWIWDNSNTSYNSLLNNYLGANTNGDQVGSTPSYSVMVGSGSTSEYNTIGQVGSGNFINSKKGVYISGATNTTVAGNTIIGSTISGVTVGGSYTKVTQNSIYSNTVLGINIGGGIQDANGVTANDTGDTDTGTNDLMNYPVLSKTIKDSNNLLVTADLDFNASEGPFILEFFGNDSIDSTGYGEGRYFIGSITTSAIGDNLNLIVPITGASPTTGYISATATNVNSSTSEFSANSTLYVTGNTPSLSISNSTSSGNDGRTRFNGTATTGEYTISDVQYSVNGGGWQGATATDGSYNSNREDFYFDFLASDNNYTGDGYTIKVRTKNPNDLWTNNAFYFSPFQLDSPGNNEFTTNELPSFSFKINKGRYQDLKDNLSKFQVMINKDNTGWQTYIDNIPVSYESIKNNGDNKQSASSNTEGNGTYENKKVWVNYSDNNSSIKVYSKAVDTDGNESDAYFGNRGYKLPAGSYQWKVVALDRAGHSQETETRTLRINVRQVISSPNTFFPLAVLNISGLGNPDMSTSNLMAMKESYSVNSRSPIFYGIANVGSKVTLELTDITCQEKGEADCINTYETITNPDSRFGINVPTQTLISGRDYTTRLFVRLENDYNELPTFDLNVR